MFLGDYSHLSDMIIQQVQCNGNSTAMHILRMTGRRPERVDQITLSFLLFIAFLISDSHIQCKVRHWIFKLAKDQTKLSKRINS